MPTPHPDVVSGSAAPPTKLKSSLHQPEAQPRHSRYTFRLWLAGVLLCSGNVMAALGQVPLVATATASANSATTTITRLPSTAASASTASGTSPSTSLYGVQSSLLDSSITVTEYTTSAGVVFALSWQGSGMPDLNTLLGSYFNAFEKQAQASRSSRNIGTPLHLERSDLVVHSSGRMRNFRGYAYAPALIPAGVNIHAIFP